MTGRNSIKWACRYQDIKGTKYLTFDPSNREKSEWSHSLSSPPLAGNRLFCFPPLLNLIWLFSLDGKYFVSRGSSCRTETDPWWSDWALLLCSTPDSGVIIRLSSSCEYSVYSIHFSHLSSSNERSLNVLYWKHTLRANDGSGEYTYTKCNIATTAGQVHGQSQVSGPGGPWAWRSTSPVIWKELLWPFLPWVSRVTTPRSGHHIWDRSVYSGQIRVNIILS